MTARIGAGPVVRLGRPADLAEASGVYRRASLSNDGDRDNLLAHPEFLILGPEGLAEGRTQVAEQDGSVVGFATWNVTEVLIGLVRADPPSHLGRQPDWTPTLPAGRPPLRPDRLAHPRPVNRSVIKLVSNRLAR